jgi:hypothetical protein
MSVQHKHFLFVITIAVISSGCTVIDQWPAMTNPASAAKPAVTTDTDSPMSKLTAMHDSSKVDVAWIFQYYRLISTVSPKVLNDEFEKTKKDFATKKTPWDRWQMAMLLSLPSAPFHDPERSAMLFKELSESSSGQDPVINDAAFLMYSWTYAQHQAYKRAAGLEEQLNESHSANKTLQDQLNALKAIEENLYQRNKVEVPPKP